MRLRLLLNQLEAQLERMKEGLEEVKAKQLVNRQLIEDFPYAFPDRQSERSEAATVLLEVLGSLIESLGPPPDDRFPPIPDEDPQQTLRITPDV